MTSFAPRLLAVVLPALVLVAAAMVLTRPPPRETSAEIARIDKALADGRPGIVIVGNSKAGTDIDVAALTRGLGYEKKITALTVGRSSAPAWYAVLEQRVFAKGYHPELVIVYGQLGAMLRGVATREHERRPILDTLEVPSPVLEGKVLGDITGPSVVARGNATKYHDALQGSLRDFAIGAVFADDWSGGLIAAGNAVSQPALGRIFSKDTRFVQGAPARVVPVAEQVRDAPMQASGDPLLAEFDALVRANGARLVFVRAPMPRSGESVVSADVERAVVAEVNRLQDSWIDLSTLPLGSRDFLDDLHAAATGRTAITDAIVKALAEGKVLDGGVLAAEQPLFPDSIARVGAPPAPPSVSWAAQPGRACAWQAKLVEYDFLADELLRDQGLPDTSPLMLLEAGQPLTPHATGKGWGETCAGTWAHRKGGPRVSPREGTEGLSLAWATEPSVADADGDAVWWVYPGTAIEWSFTTTPEGPVRVVAEARSTQGATASIAIGDQAVAFVPDGKILRANLEAPATAPWTLSVRAAPDTWLVIDELRVGVEQFRTLVSSPSGTINPLIKKRKPDPAPPPVQAGEPVADGQLQRWDVGLAGLSDDTLFTRVGRRCSPVRVVRGGETAGAGHQFKKNLARPDFGFGHLGEQLFASPPTKGPLSVDLDPKRKCNASIWVYPGDTLQWALKPDRASSPRMPADTVAIEGIAVGDGEQRTLRVSIENLGAKDAPPQVLLVNLPTAGPAGHACFTLENPLPVAYSINVAVTADPDSWFLLDRLEIADAAHLECDG